MDGVKYDLKLFLHEDSQPDLEAFIPVFHQWIQTQCLDDILVDVVDYRHVHHGPGVILVGHDAHYAMDMAEGRPGLLYSRRRATHPRRSAVEGPEACLTSVFRDALAVCQRLQTEAAWQGRLRFRGDVFILRGNDRLLAPNTAAAYAALRPCLAAVLGRLYPDDPVELQQEAGSATRLSVAIRAKTDPGVTTLLSRLDGDASA